MNKLIKEAMMFATDIHKNQTYDEYPYFKHLQDTYNVLIDFGFSENNLEDLPLLMSAWLHDSIEDTNTSYSDLFKAFGIEVAEIVYCVTDELAKNRHERKQKTYPKIRSNPKSIIIKLADRIANVKHSIDSNNKSFVEMYKKEFEDFQKELRIYKHMDDMWDYLSKLLK